MSISNTFYFVAESVRKTRNSVLQEVLIFSVCQI